MFGLARKIRQLASIEALLLFGARGQKRAALAVEAAVQLGQEGERVGRQNIRIARAHAAAHHDTGDHRKGSGFGFGLASNAALRGVARFRLSAAPRLALGTARRAALLAWRALEILRLVLRGDACLAAAFFRLTTFIRPSGQ